MKALPRLLYLICFIGLAAVAALALNRIFQPSAATILVRAVFVAAICGAPGLVFRKLWPLALLLLLLGCYLLLRATMPVPALTEGIGGQYHFYAEQLQLGASAYTHATFLLGRLAGTDAPDLRLFFAFVVYWFVGAEAFLALSLRRAFPAVVLILVLFGFGVTVDDPHQASWPALLFLVLAVCCLVLSRALDRKGWRLRDVLAGASVSVVAALLALGLLTAAPSVATTPWQDWRVWDPFGAGGRQAYTFNWLQNYPRLLDPAHNYRIMRVQSPSPSYWRANALDNFTGSAWVTSQPFSVPIGVLPQQGDERYSYKYEIPAAELTPPGETITESFDISSGETDIYISYFFAGGEPGSLALDQEISLRMNPMRALHVSRPLVAPLHYGLTAVIPKVNPADLVGLGTDYPEDLDAFLTLPFDRLPDIAGPDKGATWQSTIVDALPNGWEWADLYDLNEHIVQDAADPYEITLRIEHYLRQSYTYSLAPPPSEFSSPYAAFIFDTRSGYCQHFAGTMALLLRYNGIPSRVAVGFATGEAESPGVYLVSTNNAHAWVEAYFPTVGWLAFDPTPGRSLPVAGASSTSPRFVDPFADGGTSEPDTVTTVTLPGMTPNTVQAGGANGETNQQGWLTSATWLPWVAAVAAVLVGWPLVRRLWRHREIHRGPLDQRLQASLALLRADLSDYGVAVPPSKTLEEVLQTLQAHVGLDPDPAFVDRADAVLFGGRNARANDLEEAETLRHTARVRLRKRHGWVRTGFAWYGMRRFSLRRGHRA
jgi:transglutaminase-like putative cysteine protease